MIVDDVAGAFVLVCEGNQLTIVLQRSVPLGSLATVATEATENYGLYQTPTATYQLQYTIRQPSWSVP